MKNYHIKDLLKKDLLIVEAKDDNIAWAIVFQKYGARAVADSTLLGKPDEISEEDAEPLVVSLDIIRGFGHDVKTFYHDYKNDDYGCKTATESLLSAIETVVYWENPLGEKPILLFGKNYGTMLAILQREWHEAELRTFDRNRTLIFVKN